MMKNKVWLLGGMGSGITVVAAIMAWACWSEYGEGYSEEQRRNWNEMVAKAGDDPFSYTDVLMNRGSSLSVAVLRERQSKSDSPVWFLEIPESVQKLPLEGMSLTALMHLADQGNGDACLEFVFRSIDGQSDFSRHSNWKSLSVIHQTEVYLKKAVAAKRPGADFLLRLLEEWKRVGNDFQGEDVPGYDDFLFLLDEGDFLLGKVYFYLHPKGVEGLDKLDAGLRRKADGGDVAALRNRGHLELLKKGRGQASVWLFDFFDKSVGMESEYWAIQISNAMYLLPSSLRPEGLSSGKIGSDLSNFFSSWLLKRARLSLKAPLRMLKEAAEGGDLHAKYLWCSYAVWGGEVFSQEDWQSHLRYVNELVKAGGVYQRNIGAREMYSIESFFYQKESREKVVGLAGEREKQEYALLFPSEPADFQTLGMDAVNDRQSFIEMYTHDLFGKDEVSRERKMYLYEWLRKSAEAGDPLSMFYFSRLLSEGLVVEADPVKAWELLQRLESWLREIQRQSWEFDSAYFCFSREDNEGWHNLRFEDAITWQRIDLVSRYGDMPGMSVDQAMERFKNGLQRDLLWVRMAEQFEKKGYKIWRGTK